MSRSVLLLGENGERIGYVSKVDATALVAAKLVRRISEGSIRQSPPDPKESNEQKIGLWRVTQSGPHGPMVPQIE